MMDGDPGIGGGKWARMCDSCRSVTCAVYCRADTAYLCAGCDARIHATNRVASRHVRVWVCEACERSPAAVKCKADAAVLCTACDADIHSANPLARRHHRIPVPSISGLLHGPPAASANMVTRLLSPGEEEEDGVSGGGDGDDEASSWLLLNSVKNSNQSNGYEVDEYLDLMEYTIENQGSDQSSGAHENHGKDDGNESVVVPVQFFATDEQQHLQLDLDFEGSKTGSSYSASICHSVSYSSMEGSVVPDMATMNDISNSHVRPPKGTIDLFSGNSIQMMPTQFTPMDREARVLRYREKRKTRKFEKTIRYASRKAYAETRPRIKGRFAKRTDVEVDQMFSATVIADSGFSIVPSF